MQDSYRVQNHMPRDDAIGSGLCLISIKQSRQFLTNAFTSHYNLEHFSVK